MNKPLRDEAGTYSCPQNTFECIVEMELSKAAH